MKSFISILSIVFSSCFLFSCLDDETVANVSYHYKQIDSVSIEQINSVHQITEITTYFTRNNACERFTDFEYRIFGNERIVTMITAKFNDVICSEMVVKDSAILNFRPEARGNYKFRFWAGNDDNNQPIFIEKQIYIP